MKFEIHRVKNVAFLRVEYDYLEGEREGISYQKLTAVRSKSLRNSFTRFHVPTAYTSAINRAIM